jgi:hypothetical protein
MNTCYLPLPLRLLLMALAALLWILLTPLLAHGAPAPRHAIAGDTAVVAASEPDSGTVQSLPDIRFHGEVRSRSEMDRTNGASSDVFTWLRSRIGATMNVGEGARMRLTVQDSRVLGADGHPSAAAGGVLALHEGFLEIIRPAGGVNWTAKVGRQEIALGNERLIGAVNWSNTGRTFDALRVSVAPGSAEGRWTATAFGAVMDERGRRFGSSLTPDENADDHVVIGAHATRALGGDKGAVLLDATLVHDMAGSYRSYVDADRTTLDVRVRVPSLSGMRVELEGAYQAGRQWWQPAGAASPVVRQDIGAWLLGARIGTASALGRLTSATLGVDVLSGDADATDGSYGAFTTPYATNHPYYGLMDVFLDPAARTGDRGLTDIFASAVVRLGSAASLRTDVHSFRLNAGDGRNLGWEADWVLPIAIAGNSTVELGYSIFRASRGATPLGLRSGEWGYVQVRVGM